MKYKLTQFPKNKDIDFTKLSQDQISIRLDQERDYSAELKRCNKCKHDLPIAEYYVKNRKNKLKARRDNTCRDCRLKAAGVNEIGKRRFSKIILKESFRSCSTCRRIKPLNMFTKNKSAYGGFSHNCYGCMKKILRQYVKQQKDEIGEFYVRQYGLRQGVKRFNKKTIENLRNEIIEKRKSKHFIDGKEFLTATKLADYILEKYGVPIPGTIARIKSGKSGNELKLSERDARVIYSGTSKGKVMVTDTINGKIFIFRNTRDARILKMFSDSAITRAIKQGTPTKITSLSKYPYPCIIERFA